LKDGKSVGRAGGVFTGGALEDPPDRTCLDATTKTALTEADAWNYRPASAVKLPTTL
jgi:hypothetical protein